MQRILLITAWLTLALLAIESAAAAAIEHSVQSGGRNLVYLSSKPVSSEQAAPVLVFLHGNEHASIETVRSYFAQWENAVHEQGWNLVLPWSAGAYSFTSDTGVHALDAILDDYATRVKIDRERVYLAGHGDGAPAVFYALSRRPERWAAGLAIGGDVGRAIETNRLFAGNAAAIPILWVYEEERQALLRQSIERLKSAGFDLSLLAANEFSVKDSIAWLGPRHAEAIPVRVDYETGSPDFTRNRWVNIRSFDFSLRNDALDSTRVDPGTGAFLRLGGFGYDPAGPGPGLRVKWLPNNYKGPLKQEDVIASIGGIMIEDARHYAEFMEAQRESRDVGIILLRNGKAQRIETRIVIPHREETDTARVHGEYLADAGEIMLVSRGVKALEVTVPDAWAPVKLSWNGIDLAERAQAGCWVLTEGQTEAQRGCGVSAPASSDQAANK
ncbi:MAG: hypothetical protein LC114_03830 [Bryobacterales bacterium]|nr:hypothetical protein [Bryobacterales bacterium]